VIQQVLTGTYADGLGKVKQVPDRIDFDPFPWHSMGVWILTQMKRWGYIEGDIDYKAVAEQVYLASDARKIMTELGYDAPAETYSRTPSWARPSIRRRRKTMSPASPSDTGLTHDRHVREQACGDPLVRSFCLPASCCGRPAIPAQKAAGELTEYERLTGAARRRQACRPLARCWKRRGRS
jgi:hypothetical protein